MGEGTSGPTTAEDLIEITGDEVHFLVGKFAGRVASWQDGGLRGGALVLVFLNGELGFTQALQSVHEAEVFAGIVLKSLEVRAGRQFEDHVGESNDTDLDSDVGEGWAFARSGELEETFLELKKEAPGLQSFEVILVSAAVPKGDVGLVQIHTPAQHLCLDLAVGKPLVEEFVYELDGGFAEAGDFSITPTRSERLLRDFGGGSIGARAQWAESKRCRVI